MKVTKLETNNYVRKWIQQGLPGGQQEVLVSD